MKQQAKHKKYCLYLTVLFFVIMGGRHTAEDLLLTMW